MMKKIADIAKNFFNSSGGSQPGQNGAMDKFFSLRNKTKFENPGKSYQNPA